MARSLREDVFAGSSGASVGVGARESRGASLWGSMILSVFGLDGGGDSVGGGFGGGGAIGALVFWAFFARSA